MTTEAHNPRINPAHVLQPTCRATPQTHGAKYAVVEQVAAVLIAAVPRAMAAAIYSATKFSEFWQHGRPEGTAPRAGCSLEAVSVLSQYMAPCFNTTLLPDAIMLVKHGWSNTVVRAEVWTRATVPVEKLESEARFWKSKSRAPRNKAVSTQRQVC